MSNEAAGGDTGGKFPETEGLVPGGRESVRAVGRDDLFARMRKLDSFTSPLLQKRTQSETM